MDDIPNILLRRLEGRLSDIAWQLARAKPNFPRIDKKGKRLLKAAGRAHRRKEALVL